MWKTDKGLPCTHRVGTLRRMAEETWHAARLIPTSGINGAEEQERRATSALLSVLTAVKEFGRALTTPLGAPAGLVEAFIEVPFNMDGKRYYPDGLLRVSRGKRQWTALVEVKTGANCLEAQQLEAYLDIARFENFDAVLTISNELAALPGMHPTAIDRRKMRRIPLHHLSWTQVLTEAVMQKVHRGIADPDQAWILGELIRYLEHPRSGALEFDDMGAAWVTVRNAIEHGTLRASDKAAVEVASRWDQLVRYACLRLGRQLGIEVQPGYTRRELTEPGVRAQAVVASLVNGGVLESAIRIPNTVGPLAVSADLRASRVFAAVDIEAPRTGKSQTRVNWLLRQLRDAPDLVRVDAYGAYARTTTGSGLLRDLRRDPAALIGDPKKDLRAFRVTMSSAMGSKRGAGRGSFIGSVLELIDAFYESTVQMIKPWAAAPPKLRAPEVVEIEPHVSADLPSTSLSSQDGTGDAGRDSLEPSAIHEPRVSPG